MSLVDDPFSYRTTRAGRVLVSRGGRLVVAVGGERARRSAAAPGRDGESDQQILARAIGNDRQGDEERPTRP